MAKVHFKQNLGKQKCLLAMQILILLHQTMSFSGQFYSSVAAVFHLARGGQCGGPENVSGWP